MNRTTYGLIALVGLVVCFLVVANIDYTDKYVADRFHKALKSGHYEPGTPFSLDAFLEYYDWDTVHVVIHGQDKPDLRTQFGLPFSHWMDDENTWSLLLQKSYYVTAEIHLNRDVVDYPSDLEKQEFDRWAAIVEIVEENGRKQLEFLGD